MSDEPKSAEQAAPSAKKPLPNVVPIRQDGWPIDSHLENLRASGLSDETIRLARLFSETKGPAIAALLNRRSWPYNTCGNALVFPIFLPGGERPIAYRVRPTRPRVAGIKRNGKPRLVKYDQSEQFRILVYFTPRARVGGLYRDEARTLYWTEGEKKALVLDQLGLACVGLTGVFNWTHENSDDGDALDPLIRDNVSIARRHHVICFDADAPKNEMVMEAAARLAGVLLASQALSVRFVHPSNPEQKGIDDFYATFGEELTRKLLDSAWPIEAANPKEPRQKLRSIKALRDAGVEPDLRMPDGYVVEKDGSLWKAGDEKHGDAQVSRKLVLIRRYLDDYYSRESRVEVLFECDGRWETICVTRKAIADSRTMVNDLSTYGAPVTSSNSGRLVDWLDAFEQCNSGRIEHIPCVDKTGWHTIDGAQTFVLHEPIVATVGDDAATAPRLEIDTRGHRKRMFKALQPRGSLKAHLDALQRSWKTEPISAAMVCGALAAPLLAPLLAPNFGMHLTGDSSRGKTSMVKIAGSVFGDPNNDQWVASWNTTKVGAELRAAALNDLPLCFDEVGAGDRQQTDSMVYMLVNGVGKSRGQKDRSLQETPSWRTIVLSTGEHELVDEAAMTGAQVRVLQFPVASFGQLTGREVDELREECTANSGSFGRQWIEALLEIDDWDKPRRVYEDFKRILRERSTDTLKSRTAAFWALLCTAETMASGLGVGEPGGVTMQRLFIESDSHGRVRPAAERARGLVEDWVTAEQKAFPLLQRGASGAEEAATTTAQVVHGYQRPDGATLFIPAQLKTFCDKNNLAYREVLREWGRRQWLEHDRDGNLKTVRIGSQPPRKFVVLRQPAEETVPDVQGLSSA